MTVFRGLGAGLLVLAVAAVAGCSSPVVRGPSGSGPVSTAHASSPSPSAFHSVRSYHAVAAPVRLRIPSKKINTRLQHLGLAPDGTIAAPSEWQLAGWYDEGPRPGQEGPAVIVGHIDTHSKPAVFWRVPQLRAGDAVYVDRADGSTVRFVVKTQRQFPKKRFPADLVYSPTLKSSLLLITCGGIFDHKSGHYLDNIVVSAVPG